MITIKELNSKEDELNDGWPRCIRCKGRIHSLAWGSSICINCGG